MKHIFRTIILLLIASLVLATPAFAKNDNAKKSLVALGDSIPFGYNLGEDNLEPSKYAFPYLMGDAADLRVRNLAVPGWRTDHLLPAIQHDQKFRQAIRHADYITLNIGSNDLLLALHAANARSGGNPLLFQLYLNEELQSSPMLENLSGILLEISSLTDASVVLYNIYNPFQTNDPLHGIGTQFLPALNGSMVQIPILFQNVKIADAYTAYGSNQAEYVRINDIHPTIAGQQKLAEIGLEALELPTTSKKGKK